MKVFKATFEDKTRAITFAKNKNDAMYLFDCELGEPMILEELTVDDLHGLFINEDVPLPEDYDEEPDEEWYDGLVLSHVDGMTELLKSKGKVIKKNKNWFATAYNLPIDTSKKDSLLKRKRGI